MQSVQYMENIIGLSLCDLHLPNLLGIIINYKRNYNLALHKCLDTHRIFRSRGDSQEISGPSIQYHRIEGGDFDVDFTN